MSDESRNDAVGSPDAKVVDLFRGPKGTPQPKPQWPAILLEWLLTLYRRGLVQEFSVDTTGQSIVMQCICAADVVAPTLEGSDQSGEFGSWRIRCDHCDASGVAPFRGEPGFMSSLLLEPWSGWTLSPSLRSIAGDEQEGIASLQFRCKACTAVVKERSR
jgi:hypothetical protein